MTEPKEGPGPALLAARQAREIAVHEVAEVLNLPIETVEAIEANHYELLPSAVFAKGYIRAYARLLEMDSDPLVAAYPNAAAETVESEAVVTDRLGEFIRAYPQWVLGGAAALVLLLLSLLVVWVWPDGDDAVESEVSAATTVRPPSVPEDTVPAGELAPGAAGASLPEPALPSFQDEPQERTPTTQVDRLIVDQPSTAQPATGLAGTVRRISPDGDDRLQFQFTEECWVEVKSGAGGSLYSDLGRVGQSLELVGRAPFRILLGYAPGASMSFNDEPVALAPHTRNNVANLVLGQ